MRITKLEHHQNCLWPYRDCDKFYCKAHRVIYFYCNSSELWECPTCGEESYSRSLDRYAASRIAYAESQGGRRSTDKPSDQKAIEMVKDAVEKNAQVHPTMRAFIKWI